MNLATEKFYLTRNSSVVLSDHNSFFCHYGEFISRALGSLGNCPFALSSWLSQNLSIVSASQLAPNDVNSRIPTTTETVIAGRPKRYGRACVLDLTNFLSARKADGIGISHIDLKGVGVGPNRTPVPDQYCTGLMSLVEAIEEYFWFRIVDEILSFSRSPFRCATIYGIIMLDFSLKEARGKISPAAIIFREPTTRNAFTDLPGLRTQGQKDTLALELTLRQFGVTSSPDSRVKVLRHTSSSTYLYGCPGEVDPIAMSRHAYPDVGKNLTHEELDLVNVQIGVSDIDGAQVVVDFGQYKTKDKFLYPIISTVSNGTGGFGGVMWTENSNYPQPNPNLKIADKYWGQHKTRRISRILSTIFVRRRKGARVNLKKIIDRIIEIEKKRWN